MLHIVRLWEKRVSVRFIKTIEENKKIFDALIKDKENIEEIFGTPLSWQRLDDKKMSRITYILDGVNVFNEDDWPQMQQFLVENMIKLNDALKKNINKLK